VLKKGDKVFVAGHRGLVGSAIVRRLEKEGGYQILTRTRQELDLMDQAAVYAFLREQKPDAVVIAAAKVGGIYANSTFPADFIGQNLIIEANLIWGSHLAGVPTVLFLGSSCIYPRETAQPIPEEALLTSKPEPTNAPYAIAKIAGLYLCDSIAKQFGRNYFTAMPPNVYGTYDNFDLKTSHVLPALIRKFHEALPNNPVEAWGTGNPRREFLHSDDVADAVHFLLQQPKVEGHVNVGTGSSVSIRELAETIQSVVGHKGEIQWNTSMPDGFPEKTMDVAKLFGMGWRPKIALRDGIAASYEWFKANKAPELQPVP
jgi:GDP-L-fucose synthase